VFIHSVCNLAHHILATVPNEKIRRSLGSPIAAVVTMNKDADRRDHGKNKTTRHRRRTTMPLMLLLLLKTTVATMTFIWYNGVHDGVTAFTYVLTTPDSTRGPSWLPTRRILPPISPSSSPPPPPPPSASSPSTTRLEMSGGGGWEDIAYHAQTAASDLAASILQGDLSSSSNVLSSLPFMYGAGLLTSVSPCVWGLLPLTISYISTAAGERDDQKTTLPTVAFAAGLAAVFCSLGITAATLGNVFGASSNTNFVLQVLSNAICLAMGFQLLGLVQLPLPTLDALTGKGSSSRSSSSGSSGNNELILIDGSGKIMSTSSSSSTTRQGGGPGGSLFRTFLLGGSSALVASPCATPVLTSILAFVAKSQNPLVGGGLLLGYTLGYATPLLLVASSGGQALVNLRGKSRKTKKKSKSVVAVDGETSNIITGDSSSGDVEEDDNVDIYAKIAPWVTPLTGGILLWYGTSGMLTALLGDPSMAGLAVLTLAL
jgi:cytochrome c-type biogenesis protein